ncbi:MAG: aldehyde dehydrogenase family protein, partial [Oscillospiraceae bacterium]|nr:aldehyde dehydrogenase family protein [Oscillospiraceae bacterium]
VAWTCPPMLLSWNLAPALAMGNTVVVKPSQAAVMGIMEAIWLWKDILPKGAVNVVLGSGGTVGEALLHHPGINKLSFTGSVDVGRRVGAAAGERIIPATLELGGTSAAIICDDADLERAVQNTLVGILSSAGEVCVANARVLVQETVYDKVLAMLKDGFERAVIGDPMNPVTQIGPVISQAHMEKVLGYIETGVKEGASLICGGGRYIGNGCECGYFVQPTLLGDVTNQMRVAREEIFGTVLCVMRFTDEQDALEQDNDSEYGLGAAIWTGQLDRALRMSRRLEAGTVWVNDYLDCSAGNPFGGYKNSGIGREVNKMALDYYSQVKNICIGGEGQRPVI